MVARRLTVTVATPTNTSPLLAWAPPMREHIAIFVRNLRTGRFVHHEVFESIRASAEILTQRILSQIDALHVHSTWSNTTSSGKATTRWGRCNEATRSSTSPALATQLRLWPTTVGVHGPRRPIA
jgi:hypothetical protein